MKSRPHGAAGVLQARGLRKAYGAFPAVRDVSLDVAAGRIVGMVGNNGAGKTTTIKMLTGLVMPDAGTVRVGGEDPRHAATRRHIGFLPEESPLYDEQTPLSYLRFFGSLYGSRAPATRRRAQELLARLRLDEEHWEKPIGDLSKGSARKVAIARCLLHDPDVLVLDEPTSGLDPQSRRDLDRLLLQQRDEGKAILLSAHDLGQVEVLCDEVLVLDAGCIVTRGSLRDLRAQWGQTRYHVRANAAFPGSHADGPLHTATVSYWSQVEEALAAVRIAGGQVLDVVSDPPRLDEILARATGA